MKFNLHSFSHLQNSFLSAIALSVSVLFINIPASNASDLSNLEQQLWDVEIPQPELPHNFASELILNLEQQTLEIYSEEELVTSVSIEVEENLVQVSAE